MTAATILKPPTTSICPVAAGCAVSWALSRLSTPVRKKCIFSRKKFVQPVRSVLVRTRTANRDKLRRVIVYISGFRTPYEPYRLFELRTRFFRMRTEQSSSHCANLSGRGPSILLAQDRSVTQKPHWGFCCFANVNLLCKQNSRQLPAFVCVHQPDGFKDLPAGDFCCRRLFVLPGL